MKIPCVIEIRCNATSEVRYIGSPYNVWNADASEANEYLWGEGNYACDCNRSNFFARAGGEPDRNEQCGDEKYSIRIAGVDGKPLYWDLDFPFR